MYILCLVVEVVGGLNDEPVLDDGLGSDRGGRLDLDGGGLVGSQVGGNVSLDGGRRRSGGSGPGLDGALGVGGGDGSSLVALDFLDVEVLDEVWRGVSVEVEESGSGTY